MKAVTVPRLADDGRNGAPHALIRLAPAQTTEVFDTYWRFAAERQNLFFRRVRGDSPPWTDDPILLQFKFTNAYRASDRVSQYLIRNVIYDAVRSPEDTYFRIILFKIFNRIDTWELLLDALGEVSYATYSYRRYDAVLTQALGAGRKIYSAAYIMPTGNPFGSYRRKHRMHLNLLERMMEDGMPSRIPESRSMGEAFELLRAWPTLGDFLAYQYVTDLNYSTLTDFSETEFVVPGPGARDGIRKCFSDPGGLTEAELIKVVMERQEAQCERLGLEFHSLWGRPLQLIDCQNLFCEVGKYARVSHPEFTGHSGRTRIKQRFTRNMNPIDLFYPPKWGINERIQPGGPNVSHVRRRDG